MKKCQWKEDKREAGLYSTKCGNRFLSIAGTAASNINFKFCPYCGGKLIDTTKREK